MPAKPGKTLLSNTNRPKKLFNSNAVCRDDTALSQGSRTNILLVPKLSPIDLSKEPLTFVKKFGYVPTVLVNASEIIESHIAERELFQIQGSMEKVEYLNHVLSRKRLTMPRNTSVHDVAEVIKVYLTRMSSEIIPEEIMSRLINIHQGGTYTDYFRVIHKFHTLLPNVCPSVHFVLQLLNKVAQHAKQNGMDARKLATIFVLDILKPLSQTEDNEDFKENRLRRVQRLPYNIMAIEYLIQNVSIFEMALPVKDNLDSGEKNNNWDAISKPTEAKQEGREGSFDNLKRKATNSSPTRETRETVEPVSKDKQMRKSNRLSFGRTSPQKSFVKTSSDRGLSSSAKSKKSPEKLNFSSLNIIKNQDNHNSSLEKAYSKVPQNQILHPTSESSAKEEFTYEENGSPNKPNTDKEQTSCQGLRETCRQPAKTKEKPKQTSYNFRKKFRSHSDSAKDLVEFKHPQRFKATPMKRGKSKEIKNKTTASKLFKNDEELLPWAGALTESEDFSLIVQSTQNPKTFQFLDRYHNTTGTQAANKVAVEPNVTPNPDTHRKRRWNKNKCSSAGRKSSSNNIRKTSRSASRSRRTQKKKQTTRPNQIVEPSIGEQGAIFEFNKVFHNGATVKQESVGNQPKGDISLPKFEARPEAKVSPPLQSETFKPDAKKKIPLRMQPSTQNILKHNNIGKRPPRPRYDCGQMDSNDNPLHFGNMLEWLCDFVLIIIAAVCAIYIYHLLLM